MLSAYAQIFHLFPPIWGVWAEGLSVKCWSRKSNFLHLFLTVPREGDTESWGKAFSLNNWKFGFAFSWDGGGLQKKYVLFHTWVQTRCLSLSPLGTAWGSTGKGGSSTHRYANLKVLRILGQSSGQVMLCPSQSSTSGGIGRPFVLHWRV